MLERLAGSTREVAEPGCACDDLVERGGIGLRAGDQALAAADGLRPFEREDRVLDREHRRRVDRLALEHALGELALGDQAEDLRQRPGRRVAFQPLDGARAEDQHAVAAFAAQHLLPGEGGDIDLVPRNDHRRRPRWSRRRRPGPARSAGIQSPLGTRTPEVVPFQVKSTSFDQSIASRSGSWP